MPTVTSASRSNRVLQNQRDGGPILQTLESLLHVVFRWIMKIAEQPSAQRARFVAGSFRLRVIYFNDSIGRIVKKVILVKLVNVVPRHDRPVITFRVLVVGDDGPLPTGTGTHSVLDWYK